MPHAGDHIVPLVGICRKTWLATGERKQVVCGLHVHWNLRSIPLGINRDIKSEWFYSDWPEPPREASFGFELPDGDDDEIPF